ncbi:MAG TPA: hypothetical protein VGK89_11990 [Candidatus Eisenbacteria bacterium]|jgi:hypothetical protein
MSPRPGVPWSAFVLGLAALVLGAAPAAAQFYDAARQALGLAPDPIERSPRLLGMGRLTLAVPDPRNRITLWDFAGNPTGLVVDDSVSTLTIRPGSASASEVHDFREPGAAGERQDLAAREVRIGYEAWRHGPGPSVFGAIGDVATLRMDTPFDADVEHRSQLTRPNLMAVIGGRVPRLQTRRLNYALRALYSVESANDEYRLFTRNGAGQYLDRDGVLGASPDIFNPDEIDAQTQGGGLAVSYSFGRALTAAVGGDGLRHKIKAENTAESHVSERRETRPVGIGQASLVGRIGPSFEWGVDGRGWTSRSTETWVFSIATGTAAIPVTGRGDFLRRKEVGSTLRARARCVAGRLELGGSFGTAYRKVTHTPPPSTDRSSFSHFLNTIYYRTQADTTIFPDTVVFNRAEDRDWDAAGGASWRLPGDRGTIGAEFHRYRDLFIQTVSGEGPRRAGWDVRGGLECRLSLGFSGRAGYLYRWEDLDELTEHNEHVASSATIGFGLRPAGATWRFDADYALEWNQADFGAPSRPRGTRQQIATEIEWSF